MPLPDHSEAIHVLLAMRDWQGGQRRPFGQYIAMLALHEAGAAGLRSGELHDRLQVENNGVSVVVAPLLRAGLVHNWPAPKNKSVYYYALTDLGVRTIEAFLNPQPAAAAHA